MEPFQLKLSHFKEAKPNVLVDTGYVQIRRYSVGYQIRTKQFLCSDQWSEWRGLSTALSEISHISEAIEKLLKSKEI
jgi:hypothetical protein